MPSLPPVPAPAGATSKEFRTMSHRNIQQAKRYLDLSITLNILTGLLFVALVVVAR